jgi:hypothetical protein
MTKNMHIFAPLVGIILIITAFLLASATTVYAQEEGGEGGDGGGIFGEGGIFDNMVVSDAEGQAMLDNFDLTLVDSITLSYNEATGSENGGGEIMGVTIPGLGDLGISEVTYNVFINTDGQYVVTTDAYSLSVLSMAGVGVFDMAPESGVLAPAAWDSMVWGSQLDGDFDGNFGLGITADQLADYNAAMTSNLFEGLFTGEMNADVPEMPDWFNYYMDLDDFGLGEGIGWYELWWILSDNEGLDLDGYDADAILMYDCNPISGYADSCDNQNDEDEEDEETENVPEPTPVPVQNPCAENERITYGTQTAEAYLVEPNYVLVVGQDPEKRGADLYFKLTVTPDIREWQEWEYETEEYCHWVGSEYDENKQGDCYWGYETRERVIDQWCEQKIQYFPRYASNQLFSASLDESSRAWIQGELADRYPGADLLHPDWQWGDNYASCYMSGYIHICEALIPMIQIEDPGNYLLTLTTDITGTPYQNPIYGLGLEAGSFEAFLLEATITQ